MDDELKHKFAPRRDKRRTHVSGLSEASLWAGSLDWRANDYDFFRLCRSVFDLLDSRYREFGFRIDQFVSRDDFTREARRQVEVYEQLRLAQCIGIYGFLYASLDVWISDLANAALEKRRANAKAVAS